MTPRKVMIIDDDEDIRDSISQALDFEGYGVIKATNGKEAIKILDGLGPGSYPGLIILDIMMPEMSGPDFLDFIHKEKRPYASIPVILATAKGSLDSVHNVHLAVEKLKKPIDLENLYTVVKRHFKP